MSDLDIRQAAPDREPPPYQNNGAVPLMERLAPHSLPAEEAVLGASLIDPYAFPELKMRLRPDDFFLLKHQYFWEAMVAVHGRGDAIDEITLMEELRHRKRLDQIGGPAFITRLMNNTPTSLNADTYGEIVKRGAIRRRLLSVAEIIANGAQDETKEIDEIADLAANALKDATADVSPSRQIHISEMMSSAYARLEDRYDQQQAAKRGGTRAVFGLTTGFKDLDDATGGLANKQLWFLGGRPAMGKSMLACQMAVNAALSPMAAETGPVLLFSLEMGQDSLADRFLSSYAQVSAERIKMGDLNDAEWEKITNATDRLSSANFALWEKGSVSVEEISRAARRVKRQQGLSLLVIDYVQLVRTEDPAMRKAEKHVKVGYVAEVLKQLAMDLDIPILCPVQLSRECEKRKDKHPVLPDLADSGDLEKHADVVLMLYRDAYYEPNTAKPNTADVGVRKHREGRTGDIELYYNSTYVSFSDIEYVRT